MDDEHEHTRQDEIAVSAGVVEYRHFLKLEWLGEYLVLAIGVIARQTDLNLGIEL